MLNIRCYGNKNHYPLVMLHGFLGSSKDFNALVKYLKNRLYCITVDLPGHGASLWRDNLRLSNFPKVLHDLLTQINIKTFALLGYSLGGRLALYCHEYFKKDCSKVFLIGSHIGLKTKKEKKKRLLSDQQWIRLLDKNLYNFLVKWYSQPLFKTLCLSTNQKDKMIKKRCQQNVAALKDCLKYLGLAKQKNFNPYLLKNAPSFVLFSGDNDHKITSIYKQLNGFGIHHHIIHNTSHAPHLEKPKKIADLIEQYF